MSYGVKWRYFLVVLFGVTALAAFLTVIDLIDQSLSAAFPNFHHGLGRLRVLWVLVPWIPLLSAPAACFRVRIANGQVEHFFIHRWFVLARQPVSEYQSVGQSVGSINRPEIVFKEGKRIRLLAMPFWEMERLQNDLAVLQQVALNTGHCAHSPPPVTLNPLWLAWNDYLIPRLAQSITEEKAFDRLPILADALEEAGCIDQPLLDHLRSSAKHKPDCWVLASLLADRFAVAPPHPSSPSDT